MTSSMDTEPRHAVHPCLACQGNKRRQVYVAQGCSMTRDCPECRGTGLTDVPPPWKGVEISELEVIALFQLAAIPIAKCWSTKNLYWNSGNAHPWWLVKTGRGIVRVGWRKRVLEIDWSDTDVRCVVTDDQVTKGDDHVHAWKIDDAVRYLIRLRHGFEDAQASAIDAMAIKLYGAAGFDAERWAKLEELEPGRNVHAYYRTLAKAALSC